jgi:hypothetical protein
MLLSLRSVRAGAGALFAMKAGAHGLARRAKLAARQQSPLADR